jgi:phosphosulfolactate synthase (CoM biosynthesis protein A)
MAKEKKRYIYRSAKTGKIVTEEYAKKNPDTTTRETVKD